MKKCYFIINDDKFKIETNSLNIYNFLKKELYHDTNSNIYKMNIKIIYKNKVDVFKKNILLDYNVSCDNIILRNNKDNYLLTLDNDSYYSYRRYVMNKIAEYYKNKLDLIILHATAIEKNGEAFLIVGEKHAGKSTISLGRVLNKGYNLISDDTCIIYKKDNSIYVEGIFSGINANEKTISLLRGIKSQYIDDEEILTKERYYVKNVCKKGLVKGIIFCTRGAENSFNLEMNSYKKIKNNLLYNFDLKKSDFIQSIEIDYLIYKYNFVRTDDLTGNIEYLNNKIKEI